VWDEAKDNSEGTGKVGGLNSNGLAGNRMLSRVKKELT
jgi:hypothetical protein